ncbi:hypothetical protein AgCh_038429 [Apium graveolens]
MSKKKDVITELSSFIWTIARLYIPLDYVNWSAVPEAIKEGWWEYIKKKYIIHEEGNDWVIRILDDDWKLKALFGDRDEHSWYKRVPLLDSLLDYAGSDEFHSLP